jgi:Ca-activated chloride channel family protein
MKASLSTPPKRSGRRSALLTVIAFIVALAIATIRNPNFWRTPEQEGDALIRSKQFSQAARTYTDPWRIGTAQYRNGDFEAAAKTFTRVPGAVGAFDQGNAWLMHGQYDLAIASYDKALGFRPHWKEAEENKLLALARKAKMEGSGKDREQEQTQSNDEEEQPDEITFDLKGENEKAQPTQINGAQMSDAELRATWLRRVQTTPADFLRTKFAYQAAHAAQPQPAK